MAYITQYDVDMDRQRKADQGLGMALQGFQGIEENRRRAVDNRDRQNMQDIELAKAGATPESIAEYRKSGDSSGIQKLVMAASEASRARKMQGEDVDRQYKEFLMGQKMEPKESPDQKAAREFDTWKQKEDYQAQLKGKSADNSMEKFEVPGFGQVRTEAEAREIRAAKADADDAIKLLDELKTLGKDVSFFDRDKINRIGQLKTIIAGKLRLPLTGPGAMTEDEFQRLVSNIGDPSSLTSTESIENNKIDQLKNVLAQTVQSKFNSAASNNQPMQAAQPMQQAAPIQQVAQKIQTMAPEQKAARLQELRAKKQAMQGMR